MNRQKEFITIPYIFIKKVFINSHSFVTCSYCRGKVKINETKNKKINKVYIRRKEIERNVGKICFFEVSFHFQLKSKIFE